LLHEPEQQKALSLHTALTVPHTHAPFWQLPEQHSGPALQAVPGVEQAQVEPAATPEQHWGAAVTLAPVGAQQVPLPPQLLPGSHCATTVQASPNDGLQA
jgi:hypothetical protein